MHTWHAMQLTSLFPLSLNGAWIQFYYSSQIIRKITSFHLAIHVLNLLALDCFLTGQSPNKLRRKKIIEERELNERFIQGDLFLTSTQGEF
jgi:hypothetical protein